MTARAAIITRTKDRPLFLQRAIESVLGQSFMDWQHVIVNDGGDAQALDKLLDDYRERYGERLHVVHHETTQGMQQAANAGIAASESTYLAIHDDDDSWAKSYLEDVVAFLEEKGPESAYQGVITQTLQIEETVNAEGEIEETDRRPYLPLPEISLFRLGYENPFPPIAFCYRRSACDTIGAYDPRFSVAGDYDFNFRFLRRFEIGVLPEPLAHYHLRRSATDSAHGNSIVTGADEHKRRYNELKNHYLRGDDPSLDPALALGLNAAKFLVEIEWLAHEINRRTRKIEGVGDHTADRIPVIEKQLNRALTLQDASFRDLIARSNGIPTIEKQLNRALALQDASFRDLLQHAQGALRDLSYANQQLGALAKQQDARIAQLDARQNTRIAQLDAQHEARTSQLGAQQEARAVDILREIQAHHSAMHEAMREKVLLQIGPFRITWKKKRRAKTTGDE